MSKALGFNRRWLVFALSLRAFVRSCVLLSNDFAKGMGRGVLQRLRPFGMG